MSDWGVRRITRRRFLTSAILTGGLVGSAVPTAAPTVTASAAAASQPGPKAGGILVRATAFEADTLDPARTTSGESALIMNNIMDGLVKFARDSVKVEPSVAMSWEVSAGGKIHTFHLREGVKFHDGTPCDAAAVKFNFDRILDSKNPFHRDDMDFAQHDLLGVVQAVEAANPATLKITLKDSYGPFLNVLATPYCGFGSPKAIKADPDGFGSHPVGNGAFKFASWTRKASLEIVRNENYWDRTAHLDKIISKYVPESSVRLSEVETGSSHLFDTVGVRDIDRVKSNPQLRLLMVPFPAWAYVYFNLRLPPMENKKVRQAICYGVDTEAIVKNLYNGIGKWPDAGPLAPGLTGYQPGLNPYKYDPVKAKALLGEAGVGASLKLSMAAYNYERPYIPAGGGKVAQAIQADLKKLDIDVDLQVLDSAPFAALRKDAARRPHLLMGGFFDDYPDQDEFIFYNGESTQTFNRSSWKNDEFDKLVREARRISDEAKRARLYQQAAKVWLEDPPQLIINYGVDASVMRKTVQNAFLTPLLMWRFDRVWLSE